MSSTRHPTRRPGRRLAASRLVWAGGLIAAPRPLLRLVGGRPDPASVTVARVLGARHAIQGALELSSWPRGRRLGAVVDGIHALTAVGLAGVDARRRRVALCDAMVAGTLAAIGSRG